MITLTINPKTQIATIESGSETNTIQLNTKQLRVILQHLHNAAYRREHDMFDLPSEVIELGTELGVK